MNSRISASTNGVESGGSQESELARVLALDMGPLDMGPLDEGQTYKHKSPHPF
jgi:hypothetical protein